MATKPDTSETLQRRKATRNLVIVVAVWGAILAFGAFLAWDRPQLARDHAEIQDSIATSTRILKLVITLSVVGIFVGGWSLALYLRQRRLQESGSPEDH